LTVLEIKANLVEINDFLESKMADLVQQQRELALRLDDRLRLFSPARRLQNERQRLDEMTRRWNAAESHRLQFAKEKINGMENRLQALSPLAVLKRGYAVVTKDTSVVTSTSQIQVNDSLRVRIQDGEFNSRVTGIG